MNKSNRREPNIQVDRVMVSLFFDIKRNLPTTQQENLSISAPDIGETMLALHKSSDDHNIRSLTEVFLLRAGEGWADKIKTAR